MQLQPRPGAGRSVLSAVLACCLVLAIAMPAANGAPDTPQVTIDPNRAPAGAPLTVTVRPSEVSTATCSFSWDGGPPEYWPCGAVKPDEYLTVTLSAPEGVGNHVLRVTSYKLGLDAPTDFVTLAVVPNLEGLLLGGEDGVQAQVKSASLELRTSGATAPSATVVDQYPAPYSVVEPGSTVGVTFGLPVQPEQLVAVPKLAGHRLRRAVQQLGRAGLERGTVTGTGRVVVQNPRAGTMVARGTRVDLTLASALTPAVVAVPDVRGLDVRDAENRLQRSGLVLDTGGPTTGTVRAQLPRAGFRVPIGSTVSVTLRATARHASRWPLVLAVLGALLALLALLAAAGWAGARLLRPRRGSRRWARQHLTVGLSAEAPRTAPASATPVSPESAIAVRVRAEPRTVVVEERAP